MNFETVKKQVQENYYQTKSKCVIPVIDNDIYPVLEEEGSLLYDTSINSLMLYVDGCWKNLL